jgi:His-Xaa-Ser system protein HxsD
MSKKQRYYKVQEIRKGIFKTDDSSDALIVKLSKEFFEKEPIMEAIHEYSKNFSVTMEPVPEGFVAVTFIKKDGSDTNEEIVYDFSNRVIDYQIRKNLDKESGKIRDIIVEYAYSPIKKNLI